MESYVKVNADAMIAQKVNPINNNNQPDSQPELLLRK